MDQNSQMIITTTATRKTRHSGVVGARLCYPMSRICLPVSFLSKADHV